jgi:PAS domain S-box-containing protein
MGNSLIGLNENELNKVFPHFMILSKDLTIEKYGKGFHKLFPEIKEKALFFNQFIIQRPIVRSFDQAGFEKVLTKLMIFSYKGKDQLLFKGHFEHIESIDKYVFFGTLALNSIIQLQANNVTISDLALNDSLVDLLYVIKNNEIVNSELNKLITDLNDKKNELQLFQSIIDSSSDAIQVADETGKMIYVNAESSRRLGIPAKEIQNYRVHDFEKIFRENDGLWQEHINQLKSKNYVTIEGSNLNRVTGKYFPVEVTAKHLEFGGVGHVVAVSRDVSERKNSERSLKIQEEKYRNIISNMNLGLLEVDNDGLIIFCNQSFERICGYELEELKGKDSAKLFGKGKVQRLIKEKIKDRKNKISDGYEVLVKNKRGEAKWWLVSGGANLNDSDEVIGAISIHLDITDQKQLELDLEEALTKSEQASRAKETFLANMSHEIRTPLNGILGMIQALKLEKLNEDQNSYVESAQIASEHLLSVINNILDFTKIEAGELELIKQNFSLNKVVKDVKHILRNQVNSKNVDFNTNLVNVAPALLGDEAQLRQILINLVGNAIKFTEKGSINVICTGGIIQGGVQELRIEIKDTGIGIDSNSLSKVFQKFQQEDVGISRKFGGTGLGLVITKELVELMEGELNLSSEKGVGTQIEILLRLPIGEEMELKEEKETIDASLLSGLNILLVEDNDMNRLVVKHTLSQTKVNLEEVVNGKEAIKIIKEKDFDLILMDVQMPIMGGMEATEIIRKTLKKNVPIIAFSANAFKSEIDACLAIGFNDYIIKPFQRNTLLSSILKHTIKKDVNLFEQNKVEKLYNLEVLKSLAMRNQEFMESMIDLFIDIIPKSVKEIQDAFDNNDYESILKVAHRIKPSIDNMGIVTLNEPIRELEKFDFENEDIHKLKSLVYLVTNTLMETISQLKSER